MGPTASQVAIKQTGTNGGGYMGVNSAHPLESLETDCGECGDSASDFHSADSGGTVFHIRFCGKEQEAGYCNLYGMFLCLVVALSCIAVTEQAGTSQLAQNGAVNM